MDALSMESFVRWALGLSILINGWFIRGAFKTLERITDKQGDHEKEMQRFTLSLGLLEGRVHNLESGI